MEAYQDWVVWCMTKTLQYVGKDQEQVINAINQIIKLFQEAKTRKVASEEYEAAWAAARAAEAAARAAEAAARAAEAAEAAAKKEYSEKFIEILRGYNK